MDIRIKLLYFFIHCFIFFVAYPIKQGVIAVPVADLVAQPLSSFYKTNQPIQKYSELPYAGKGKKHFNACPRLHQALFNEQVEILDTKGSEVKIRIPNAYYLTHQTKTPQHDYWTARRNVIPLETIPVAARSTIPGPLSFKAHTFQRANHTCITLKYPFYSREAGCTFSAGTRFKKGPQNKKNTVVVQLFDPKTKERIMLSLPKKNVFIEQGQTVDQRKRDMITLLKEWAHTKGTIPYVWGGCSLVYLHPQNRFNAIELTKDLSYITRFDTKTPKTGMDCSGLIIRAAQIVGLPYTFKNTYTLAEKLTKLTSRDFIKAGDLIWIYGHVMIVSDLKNNSIIEARSYEHGYGKLQEIPLVKVFKNMKDFACLEQALRKKQPLIRLDKDGMEKETFHEFKLLRMS